MHVKQILHHKPVRDVIKGTGEVSLRKQNSTGLSFVKSLVDEVEQVDEVVAGGGVLEASI